MKFKILKGFRHSGQFFAKEANQEAALLATKPTSEQLADWKARGLIEGEASPPETSELPSELNTLSFTSLRAASEAVTVELLDTLEDEADDDETPVQVLTRIIEERDKAQSQVTQVQSDLQSVQGEVEVVAALISASAPFERKSDETPIDSLKRFAQSLQDRISQQLQQKQQQMAQTNFNAADVVQNVEQTVQEVAVETEQTKKPGTPISPDELTKATNATVALAILNAGFDTKEKIREATKEQLDAIDGVGEQTIQKLRELAK